MKRKKTNGSLSWIEPDRAVGTLGPGLRLRSQGGTDDSITNYPDPRRAQQASGKIDWMEGGPGRKDYWVKGVTGQSPKNELYILL